MNKSENEQTERMRDSRLDFWHSLAADSGLKAPAVRRILIEMASEERFENHDRLLKKIRSL